MYIVLIEMYKAHNKVLQCRHQMYNNLKVHTDKLHEQYISVRRRNCKLMHCTKHIYDWTTQQLSLTASKHCRHFAVLQTFPMIPREKLLIILSCRHSL